MSSRPIGYSLVPYEGLHAHAGMYASFLQRLPTGRLVVCRGVIEPLNMVGQPPKILLSYVDGYFGGVVIELADRVYVKSLP